MKRTRERGNMLRKIKFKGGDENDAFTRARKFYFWQPGQIRKAKRSYAKRFRKVCRLDAKGKADDHNMGK